MDLVLVFQFYLGGKINETRGSFVYEPSRCKKVILVKYQISYDELVDRVYTYMQLDQNVFKLNLWFRNVVGQNIFVVVQSGAKMTLTRYIIWNRCHTACEIYVEVEPQTYHIHSEHDARQTSLVQFDFEKKSITCLVLL